jgi:Tfp pilus assembly protein PilF
MVLYQAGDLVQARQYFEQALASMEKGRDVVHYHAAQILSNLGMVFWQSGDHVEARRYLRRALTTYQLTLGLDHPETHAASQNLERLKKHALGHDEAAAS